MTHWSNEFVGFVSAIFANLFVFNRSPFQELQSRIEKTKRECNDAVARAEEESARHAQRAQQVAAQVQTNQSLGHPICIEALPTPDARNCRSIITLEPVQLSSSLHPASYHTPNHQFLLPHRSIPRLTSVFPSLDRPSPPLPLQPSMPPSSPAAITALELTRISSDPAPPLSPHRP